MQALLQQQLTQINIRQRKTAIFTWFLSLRIIFFAVFRIIFWYYWLFQIFILTWSCRILINFKFCAELCTLSTHGSFSFMLDIHILHYGIWNHKFLNFKSTVLGTRKKTIARCVIAIARARKRADLFTNGRFPNVSLLES